MGWGEWYVVIAKLLKIYYTDEDWYITTNTFNTYQNLKFVNFVMCESAYAIYSCDTFVIWVDDNEIWISITEVWFEKSDSIKICTWFKLTIIHKKSRVRHIRFFDVIKISDDCRILIQGETYYDYYIPKIGWEWDECYITVPSGGI